MTFKEQVLEVLQTVDVLGVLADLGCPPIEYGEPNMCRCPFHGDEGRPNMAVYVYPSLIYQAAHYYCFACNQKGDLLELACTQLKCSKREGLDFLAGKRSYQVVAPPRRARELGKDYLNFAKKCHERLMSCQGVMAREYLASRRLLPLAEDYMLGLTSKSDTSWSERLTIPFLQSFEDRPIHMMKARTLNHFREGREFNKASDGNKYLNTAGSTLEPYLYRIAMNMTPFNSDTLLIVEGEIDALTATRILPCPIVIGVPGVRAIRDSWVRDMSGLDTVVVLDSDKHGDCARAEYTRLLEAAGAYVHHAYVPLVNQDLNSYYVADSELADEWLLSEMTREPNRVIMWS